MSKKDDGSGKVKEPRVSYRTLRRLGRRRPAAEVMKGLAEVRKLTKGKAKGKDAVTLVREERDR